MSRAADIKLGGLVVALALFGAGVALAAEPVVAAGGAPAPPVSTGDQIDAFLKTSPVPDLPRDGAAGVTSSGPRDRTVHGFVDVAAGTGGYRSVSGLAQMPLGENGMLTVSGGEMRGRDYGTYGGDWRSRSLGASLALGPAAQAAGDPRCARSMSMELEPRRAWLAGDPPPVCRIAP